MLLDDFRSEYARYRKLGDGALAQITDDGLNAMPSSDGNSVALIVHHVGGNLVSRFTNFTTTDGEKPDRNREGEFEIRTYTRDDVAAWWANGWSAVETPWPRWTTACSSGRSPSAVSPSRSMRR